MRHASCGSATQTGMVLRQAQYFHHPVCQNSSVEEIHQQAVFTVSDRFPHRRGIRGDEQAAAGHGFEHRPGKDEGIGEVDVDSGYLEQAAIVRVGDFAEEVDAAHVQRHFALHLFAPVGRVGWFWAIAGFVAADDDNVAAGMARQDFRQGAHEDVEAPVGFQVARHIGNHRVAGA